MEIKKKEIFGLAEDIVFSLYSIFENSLEVEEVIIFGSRAKGNYRPGSDIDLAIKGEGVTFETILAIMSEIENLELLYKADVINYYAIHDKNIIDHIDRVGKVFWKRTSVLSDTIQ